jgi:hypothetical protein
MKLRRPVAPILEIFEDKVLLSSGIGKPAATAAAIIASKTPKPFIFNGKLSLKLTATYSGVAAGFRKKNSFPPMGEKVKVSGTLASAGSTLSNGLPNLSGSTFELSNASGKLLVTLSSSTTDVYEFTISGRTKRLARADGTTGTATFGFAPKKEFALTFKTTGHGSQSSNPPISGTLVAIAAFNGSSSGTNGGNPDAGVTLDTNLRQARPWTRRATCTAPPTTAGPTIWAPRGSSPREATPYPRSLHSTAPTGSILNTA